MYSLIAVGIVGLALYKIESNKVMAMLDLKKSIVEKLKPSRKRSRENYLNK